VFKKSAFKTKIKRYDGNTKVAELEWTDIYEAFSSAQIVRSNWVSKSQTLVLTVWNHGYTYVYSISPYKTDLSGFNSLQTSYNEIVDFSWSPVGEKWMTLDSASEIMKWKRKQNGNIKEVQKVTLWQNFHRIKFAPDAKTVALYRGKEVILLGNKFYKECPVKTHNSIDIMSTPGWTIDTNNHINGTYLCIMRKCEKNIGLGESQILKFWARKTNSNLKVYNYRYDLKVEKGTHLLYSHCGQFLFRWDSKKFEIKGTKIIPDEEPLAGCYDG
jgi:hypothetical protein